MAAVAPNTERTTVVDRLVTFEPRFEHIDALASVIVDRRGAADEAAVAIAVMDGDGVRGRVVTGPLPGVLAIGRHPACDLHLRQADASMRHALVVADDDGVRIVDLSSSFGLAGRAVAKAGIWATVRAGDSVIAAALLRPGEPLGDVSALHAVWRPDLPRGVARPRTNRMRVLDIDDVAAILPAPSPVARTPQVIRGDRGSITVTEIDAPVLIGRDTRCGVRVEDNSAHISRVHAALIPVRVRGERQLVLVDVGSTNGTEVLQASAGGIREVALGPVGRGQVVGEGDIVELAGNVRLRLVGRRGDGQGHG